MLYQEVHEKSPIRVHVVRSTCSDHSIVDFVTPCPIMDTSPASGERRSSPQKTSASFSLAKKSTTGRLGSLLNDCKTPPVKSLLSKPPELIYKIVKSLDPVSSYCLYFTCKWLFRIGKIIRAHGKPLTRCQRWLISTRLEQDLLNSLTAQRSGSEPLRRSFWNPFKTKSKDPLPESLSKFNCALCKIKHLPAQFLKDSAHPQFRGLMYNKESELLTSKSLPRLCSLHIARIVRASGDSPKPTGRWISCIRKMCLHCGGVLGFGENFCAGTRDDLPACHVCPVIEIRVYRRIPKSGEGEMTEIEFKNAADGTLYVFEKFRE